jgi:hypothetical protein
MDLHSLDHSLPSVEVDHNSYTDLHTTQDLHTHQDLLNDPAIGVHHDPFAPSSIGVYEPNHVHSGFDSHNLADYQPHHANSLLDHQYPHINHSTNLDYLSQRSGSASFTPSSPAEVVKNKEVIIKDEFGHDKSGTVTDKHSDGTYKVETSKEVYDNVSYHDVQKYGPK